MMARYPRCIVVMPEGRLNCASFLAIANDGTVWKRVAGMDQWVSADLPQPDPATLASIPAP